MRNAFGLIILVLVLSLGSCVPTSKITYLQESKSAINDSLISIRKVQPPYRLQVNDALIINVKSSTSQNLLQDFIVSGTGIGDGYVIDSRGDVRIPRIGTRKVLGMTLEEVREIIEEELKNTFKEEAEIFVTVNLAGLRYTLVGEIGGPGLKTIQRDQVNIIEAIADAGGVPVTGDLTKVKIVRNYPDGVRVHEVDLTRLDVIYSPYYAIQPNDMIVVNPLPQKAIGIGTTGLASFSTIIGVITTLTSIILLGINLNR